MGFSIQVYPKPPWRRQSDRGLRARLHARFRHYGRSGWPKQYTQGSIFLGSEFFWRRCATFVGEPR